MALTPAQYAALKTEIQTNAATRPLLLKSEGGTSDNATQDQAVADALNNLAGGSNVAMLALPKDALLMALNPTIVALAAKTAAIQGKWDRILTHLRSLNGPFTRADLAALFTLGIADGIWANAAAVDALWAKAGSRTEVLLTLPGYALTAADVSFALRGR